MSLLMPSLVGVLLGMRHALEPDHLAAIATLASSNDGRSVWRVGAWWGVGHSAALLVVGGSLALAQALMPPRLGLALECAVAVMVMGLGVRAILQAWREGREGAQLQHAHGLLEHTHVAPPAHVHVRSWVLATRPLLVGLMHGLAGSGALTALVLARLPSAATRLSYLALFGLGSTLGMVLLTGLVGVWLRRVSRSPAAASVVLGVAGAVSVVVGLWWGTESLAQLFRS